MSTAKLYEVVEVDMDNGNAVTMMTSGPEVLSEAEAILKMAIMRRSTESNFFAVVAAGRYQSGDKYDKGTGIAG